MILLTTPSSNIGLPFSLANDLFVNNDVRRDNRLNLPQPDLIITIYINNLQGVDFYLYSLVIEVGVEYNVLIDI